MELGENEHILTVVHSFFLTQWLIITASVIALSATSFGTFWFISKGTLGYAGLVFGLIVSFALFIKGWNYNRQSFIIITNERVVDVTREGAWKQTVSGVRYHAIKDVVVDRSGVNAAIFSHGTLTVITEDDAGSIELSQVRYPERLQRLVLERKEIAQESFKVRALPDLFSSFLQALPRFNEIQLILLEKKIQDRLKAVDTIDSTLF